MDPSHFLAELKRRNVYKVAAAYGVVAWLLIQAASIIFPTYEVPAWTMKVLIAALAIGFPVAAILAWAFELTPEGLVRSDEVAPNESITRRTGRKLDFLIIGVLMVVITLLVTDRFWRRSVFPSATGKSIAVLPFENLSRDPDNAFFADGIQDDILTNLAKIADLKVISRTSVMQYRSGGVARNLGEIAKALGVENILEGSVRRDANRVLVSAQLIDAHDGRHIWAERYDRTIADSIGLQGELAAEIAGALRMKLAPAVKASLENKPTENPDAYVFYLRGREYQMRPEVSRDNYLAAENFYKQAVVLDPRFVLARARLAEIQNGLYAFFDHRPARLGEARANSEEALHLDPNCGQAHLALAQCMQHAGESPETIKREVETAIRLLPNDGYIALAAAILQNVMGWNAESAASFERAIVLNPREGKVIYNYGILLYEQQDIPRARWAFDRALELSPDSIYFRLFRARAEIEWTGDVALAKAILAKLPADKDPDGRVTAAHCSIAIYERNFPEALRLLDACSHERIPFVGGGFGKMVPKNFLQGIFQFYITSSVTVLRNALTLLEADKEADQNVLNLTLYALTMMERNYPAAEQALAPVSPKVTQSKTLLQAMIQLARQEPSELIAATLAPDFTAAQKNLEKDPDNADNHSTLGLFLALAGKKEDAVREGLRGLELAKPGFPKNFASANLALIYAQTDKENEAVTLLESLLTQPGLADVHPDSIVSITLADLRLRPQWDPLRNDERFKKLLAGSKL
jgi:TolB-like protein/Flp pilus assembly protein TadD